MLNNLRFGMRMYMFIMCVQCIPFSDSATPCITPNGEQAWCAPLHSCSILKQSYYSGDPALQAFVEASACKNENFNVCCGTFDKMVAKTEETTEYIEESEEERKNRKINYALKHLLPNTTYCGLQHWDDYYNNDNETFVSVNEFPWLLEFRKSEMYTLCSAVLISNRYALTTVPCIEDEQKLTVVIGQQEVNLHTSCVKTAAGIDDCTDPTIHVKIEEKLRFLDTKLVLVRLANIIVYTDYVRPICLSIQATNVPKIGDTVYTAGWGTYWSYAHRQELTTRKFKYPFSVAGYNGCGALNATGVTKSPFFINYSKEKLHLYYPHTPGPVMYKNKRSMNWILEGFVLRQRFYGDSPSACAEQITPEMIQWILENMRD